MSNSVMRFDLQILDLENQILCDLSKVHERSKSTTFDYQKGFKRLDKSKLVNSYLVIVHMFCEGHKIF